MDFGGALHVLSQTGSRRATIEAATNRVRLAADAVKNQRQRLPMQSTCGGTGRCQSGSAGTRPWLDGTGTATSWCVRSGTDPSLWWWTLWTLDSPRRKNRSAGSVREPMPIPSYARWMLEQEARALLTRLARVKPFALQESMLPAANLLPGSQLAIEKFLMAGRKRLRKLVRGFLHWLTYTGGALERRRAGTTAIHNFAAAFQCRGYSLRYVRQRHYAAQRKRHRPLALRAGCGFRRRTATEREQLQSAAGDLLCSTAASARRSGELARGCRAAGTTRSPSLRFPENNHWLGNRIVAGARGWAPSGGVAGSGGVLASGARGPGRGSIAEQEAWQLWKRWISEIVADFWSIARVGIASTLGLMGVVSLPRAFVFRLNVDDPHPTPWIRVKLSAAIGKALFPQPAWDQLAELWESYYPLDRVPEPAAAHFSHAGKDDPGSGRGAGEPSARGIARQDGAEALDLQQRQPARLRMLLDRWRVVPRHMYRDRADHGIRRHRPGGMDNRITPEEESVVVGKLLSHSALQSTLEAAANCVVPALAQSKPCGCHSAT